MKPHRFAQMANEVRDLAFDFGTSEQFRDRVADLLGKYIHVEHGSKGEPEQTEAPAVVVPEVPMGTALQRLGLRLTQILDGHEFAVLEHEFLNPAIEEMQNLSVLSGRVLGDGMVAVDPKSGAGRIWSERMRQISHEGWTREHDMHHSDGELAQAAACYAWPPPRPLPVKQAWPWERGAWKPTAPEAIPVVCECRTVEECWHGIVSDDAKIAARQRDLEKAGALIAAEIDRLNDLRANQGGAAR